MILKCDQDLDPHGFVPIGLAPWIRIREIKGWIWIRIRIETSADTSVVDPDSYDLYVFGPSGS